MHILIGTHKQTHISVPSDSFSHSKVQAKNRSLLQPLRASLVMLSCVWRGQRDVCNWLSAAHILKVSMELKATHWLNGSLTDKGGPSASPEELHLSMESYQYAFSALLTVSHYAARIEET